MIKLGPVIILRKSNFQDLVNSRLRAAEDANVLGKEIKEN